MSFCPTHNKVYLPTYFLLIDLMLFFVRQLQFSKSVNDVVQVWEGGGRGCLPSTGLTSKSNGPPIEEMYTKAKAKALPSKSTNLNLNWIDLIYGSVKRSVIKQTKQQ
jgi:hypothetical protein